MRNKLVLLFPLCAGLLSAATLTSGTFIAIIGDQAFAGWQFSAAGPGVQINASRSNTFPGIGVPLCTGTCTYTFSGTPASSGLGTSFVLNGTSYSWSNYISLLSMTFTGTPQTVTADCVNCVPGRPPLFETTWSANPFTMTGVVTVLQQTANGTVTILTENISGQGFTTGFSRVSGEPGPWNYSATTFTFVPETSSFLFAATGLLAIAALRRGRPIKVN